MNSTFYDFYHLQYDYESKNVISSIHFFPEPLARFPLDTSKSITLNFCSSSLISLLYISSCLHQLSHQSYNPGGRSFTFNPPFSYIESITKSYHFICISLCHPNIEPILNKVTRLYLGFIFWSEVCSLLSDVFTSNSLPQYDLPWLQMSLVP